MRTTASARRTTSPVAGGDRSAMDAAEQAFVFAEAGQAAGGRPAERVRIVRVRDGTAVRDRDAVAAEEPLEVRLGGEAVAVTMRTPAPSEDAELALGFLLGEGIVGGMSDVARVVECRSGAEGGAVDVRLRTGAAPATGWQRNFYATSSCGICGKASIDAVRVATGDLPEGPGVDAEILTLLPERLRAAQRIFEATGGLHAAGIFTVAGELIVLREDVGRHNAVDKAVGRAAMDGRLPLTDVVLQVSGRASFEIVQKAAMAGIPIVAAVSAPSSLAIGLAEDTGMTLVGFLRQGGFNVYAGADRIRLKD